MGISFVRTIILYICVVIALRIMGKRQLGELQPSELVVAFMISDLASVPMQSKGIPLLDGIVPIFTLVVLELLGSILVLKSEKIRTFLTGRPTQIIKDGKISFSALSALRICIDDVLEQLRIAGYSDLSQIDSAFIETNGQMSVIPTEGDRPLTCRDVKYFPKQTHIPYTIIADGTVRKDNMKKMGYTPRKLSDTLAKYDVTSAKEVLYMSVTDDGKTYIQLYET